MYGAKTAKLIETTCGGGLMWAKGTMYSSKQATFNEYNYKNKNWLQFLFIVKAAVLKKANIKILSANSKHRR